MRRRGKRRGKGSEKDEEEGRYCTRLQPEKKS